MSMSKFAVALGLAVLLSGLAGAAPVFVGSFAVYDGPNWTDNPPVYSAQEAAALIFGGDPSDYSISIDPSLDPLTITHTAWYDGWGEHDGMIYPESYKLDLGNPGYNDPGDYETARSAYVHDGLSDTEIYRNYVWSAAGPAVPEPGTYFLLASGLAALALIRRKNA